MSEKKQITVCICYDGDEEKLNKTMASFGDSYAERVKTVVLERRGKEAVARVLVLTGVPQKTPVMAWQEKDRRIHPKLRRRRKRENGMAASCGAAMPLWRQHRSLQSLLP